MIKGSIDDEGFGSERGSGAVFVSVGVRMRVVAPIGTCRGRGLSQDFAGGRGYLRRRINPGNDTARRRI